jgi:hypothetical protein
MILIYDLIFAVILGTIIFIIIWKIRSRNLIEPYNLLNTIFESYFSGFTIYLGLASIIYSFSNSIPFGLTNIVSENIISFFGGLSILSITVISLFRKEILSRGKILFFKGEDINVSEISINRVNYFFAYKKYKELSQDPQLNVIRIFKDGTMQVDTRTVENYLNKDLFFNLRIKKSEIVQGREELIPTREIAICKLESHGSLSIFKILKWIKLKEYKADVDDLKKNINIDVLKPFIDLRPEYLADKCSLQDLENVKKGLDNLIRIQAGE